MMNIPLEFFSLLLQLISAGAISSINDVHKYEVVHPYHVKTRSSRDLSTRVENNLHLDVTEYYVSAFKKDFVLKLTKNRELFPPTLKLVSENSDGSRHIGSASNMENCYYHGNVKGKRNSSVILSTCEGLSGLIRDEDGEEYFIEPMKMDKEIQHIMYRMRDLKIKHNTTCNDTDRPKSKMNTIDPTFYENKKIHKRQRRKATEWKYIETVVVVDNRLHLQWGNDSKKSQAKALEIMNHVDHVYKTINIRVSIISIIIWKKDQIVVESNSQLTFNRFSTYTANIIHGKMKIYNDNAQLLTGITFSGYIAGYGHLESICTLDSCGVTVYKSSPALTANTVAHELGHNLGALHDNGNCVCKNPPCVMGAYRASVLAKGFSTCSTDSFQRKEANGKYLCIHDYPNHIYGKPICGDGYKEEGEECDCGTEQDCKLSGAIKCCNHSTCRLHRNAQCSDGQCCKNCTFKSKGTLCRARGHKECDLEEYCNGNDGQCPRNYYILNGMPCNNNSGYCFEGLCKTHTQQCEVLWGPDAEKGEDDCFFTNSQADKYGNCGVDTNGTFIGCSKQDELCGKIQCRAKKNKTLSTFPLLGTNRGIKILYITRGHIQIVCKRVRMNFPKELSDPTLAFDGVKCGEQSICWKNKCKHISAFSNINCTSECKNGGVCNNNGNCHCPVGFACPTCEQKGDGGSLDSGQGCYREDRDPPLPSRLVYLACLVLLLIPIAILCIWASKRRRLCFSADTDKQKIAYDLSNKAVNSEPFTPTKRQMITITHPDHIQNDKKPLFYDGVQIHKPARPPPIPPMKPRTFNQHS